MVLLSCYLATPNRSRREKMVRVFINCVDTYTGKAISKIFGGISVGGTVGGFEERLQSITDDLELARTETTTSNYEVMGSLSVPSATAPRWVDQVFQVDKKEDFFSEIVSCDIVVYHTTRNSSQVDEATWVIEGLRDVLPTFTTQKIFICVSSVMTWARSKPVDIDEPDVPFTDDDYRRRKPHANFKDMIALEKNIIKIGKIDKSKMICYVIAAGLTYGLEEEIFHFLFKAAWHGETPYLPVFGDGQNFVPTVHISDLASIVIHIAENRPKMKYILGVDDGHDTLQDITKAISMELGPRKIKSVPLEDAMFHKEITQSDYDHYQVNLLMEASAAKELSLSWMTERGLVENIGRIVKEYKDSRGLLPIRICILGAPATGKSLFASKICEHYKLHHVMIADVIKEGIEKLERVIARADADENSENESEGDGDSEAQNSQELLDMLKDNCEQNSGRYSEQFIIDFYRTKLNSMPCQNQGYVLDGFPKTYEQAKLLFSGELEVNDEELENNQHSCVLPEVIFSLDASDDFLKERVMNLPQQEVEGTHNTEEGFLRRLNLFRTQNEDDITVLNYFDELEIHPRHFSIEDDRGRQTFDVMYKIVGEPRNYGLTTVERAEKDRIALEEKMRKEMVDREVQERLELEAKELRMKREAEWASQLELVQKEEQELLEVRSLPLRNYLMHHVIPTLTKALVETCKIKPDDPVDFLAEYLFKNNPQID